MYFDTKIKLSYILLHVFTKAKLKNSIFEYASSLLTLTLKGLETTFWHLRMGLFNVLIWSLYQCCWRRPTPGDYFPKESICFTPSKFSEMSPKSSKILILLWNASIHPSVWLIIALRALKITIWKFLWNNNKTWKHIQCNRVCSSWHSC